MSPTGVALRDVREQLFSAAERVLVRDGASALTSRSVTAEAGVAKGVLHRHFSDFDDFLAELVADRSRAVARLAPEPGRAPVPVTVANLLTDLFTPTAISLIALTIFRDELRGRLRERWPQGVPLFAEARDVLYQYLTDEQSGGRVRAGADLDTCVMLLIGTGHLIFAARHGEADRTDVTKAVDAALSGVLAP